MFLIWTDTEGRMNDPNHKAAFPFAEKFLFITTKSLSILSVLLLLVVFTTNQLTAAFVLYIYMCVCVCVCVCKTRVFSFRPVFHFVLGLMSFTKLIRPTTVCVPPTKWLWWCSCFVLSYGIQICPIEPEIVYHPTEPNRSVSLLCNVS
jgi:hypothetical protein